MSEADCHTRAPKDAGPQRGARAPWAGAIALMMVSVPAPTRAQSEAAVVPTPAAAPRPHEPARAPAASEPAPTSTMRIIADYLPADLEAEPSLGPSPDRVIEITLPPGELDTPVRARPHRSAPVMGHVAAGARLPVRGMYQSDEEWWGCPSGLYYALEPFGYLCSDLATPSAPPPTTTAFLQLQEGSLLPYRYRCVRVEEDVSLPMWSSTEAAQEGQEPERKLYRGDCVAVTERVSQQGATYYRTLDGRLVPGDGTVPTKERSQFQGVVITPDVKLPFAWVWRRKARVRTEPNGEVVERLPRRTRTEVLEEQEVGRKRWLRIGDARWIDARDVAEVRLLPRPEATRAHHQWIDVDLGEQVVVAYEGERPVYATLTSSGRKPHDTPRGDYPIWAKVGAITMKSQDYDDKSYYMDRVPWVLFFQAHNALHGAYWHDGFGAPRSHGCANLSPADARYLFEWLGPKLPPGWTAFRFWNLERTPVVHVRNSHMRQELVQERPIGPPDPEEEAARLQAAIDRRAEASDVLLEPSF